MLSNRHIVKKINSVSREYRSSVLPHVVEGWDLRNDESQKMSLELMFMFAVYIPSLVWLIKRKLH